MWKWLEKPCTCERCIEAQKQERIEQLIPIINNWAPITKGQTK